MTDTSVEVLAVGGDHRLGGADWDERLFDHLMDQTIEQSGDDSIEDDEAEPAGTAPAGREHQEGAVQGRVQEGHPPASRGMAAKITVTREQFEEMTADLLEETIRITSRTLAEAEQRYPRHPRPDQRAPAGRRVQPDAGRGRAAQQGVPLGTADSPTPTSRSPRAPPSTRPARRSSSSRTAAETAQAGADDGDRPAARHGRLPGPPAAIAGGRRETGLDEEQVEKLAQQDHRQRAAQGRRHQAGRHEQAGLGGRLRRGGVLHRAPGRRADPAALHQADKFTRRHHGRQPGRDRDRDLGAGRRGPRPGAVGQPPGRRRGPDRGPRVVPRCPPGHRSTSPSTSTRRAPSTCSRSSRPAASS